MSDPAGNYEFPDLPPATYNLTVEKNGFETLQISSITLLVQQTARVDAQLRVGQVTTSVQVTGAAPIVETGTANVGNVVGSQQMVDLPLNVRHFGALAFLTPGAVQTPSAQAGASGAWASPFSDTPYSANGQRSGSNLLLLDGMESRTLRTAGFGLQPPPDAIEEFKLQTNTYDAAYGLTAGSTINVIFKSGTNHFHGGAYDFLRNNDLDARNFFAVNQSNPLTGAVLPGTARPAYRRNQFGANIGGPIQKNKTFIFGYYEGTREVQGMALTSEVPTAAEEQGNLSSFLTGQTINLCGPGGPANLNFDTGQLFNDSSESLYTCPSGANAGSTVLVGTPVTGNQFTVDPVAARVMESYPAANRTGFPNFINTTAKVDPWNQFGVRLDHTFGPKDQIFGRYLFGQVSYSNPSLAGSPLPAFGEVGYYRGQNVVLTEGHTFSPTLLGELRFGFSRDWIVDEPAHFPRAAGFAEGFGITNLTALPGEEAYPSFYFSNFASVGDSTYRPAYMSNMLEKYQANLTWVHGRHTIVAGGHFEPWQMLRYGVNGGEAGWFSFDGQYSSLAGEIPAVGSISDWADFIQGGSPDVAHDNKLWTFGNAVGGSFTSLYAQDNFKVSPNLTVNLGLRWEFRRPFEDKRDMISVMIPTGPMWSGPGNMILVGAGSDALETSYCTDPFYSYLKTSDGRCLFATPAEKKAFGLTGRAANTLAFNDYRDFAPRLGVAWRPTHSDKFVVRTGAGLFYDLQDLNYITAGHFDPAYYVDELYNPPSGQPPPLAPNGLPTTLETSLATGGIPPVIDDFMQGDYPPHSPWPLVYEWSFGIESQFAKDWALDVSYVANGASHLAMGWYNGNQPLPGVGDLQPRRPYPDINAFAMETDTANANYESLQTKLTKRFSNGLTFLAGYTYSHSLDLQESDQTGPNPQNTNCMECEYASSSNDVRQRFVLSYVYRLPVGQGLHFLDRTGVVDKVLGGWELSGIFSVQSGFPQNIESATDYSNTGSQGPRPDRICNGTGPQTVSTWFNASCFSTTALEAALASGNPRFGNAGRNILPGPGLEDWDFALLKSFRLTERVGLEYRFESFDFLNHANFGAPGLTLGTATFGVLTSATGGSTATGRDIQMSLKLSF
jgi:hypothetical protein